MGGVILENEKAARVAVPAPWQMVHAVRPVLYITAFLTINALATDDMWTVANTIIVDVYTKIAGISTVLAGLMSAVAVIGAKLSITSTRWTRRGTGSNGYGSHGPSSTASALLCVHRPDVPGTGHTDAVTRDKAFPAEGGGIHAGTDFSGLSRMGVRPGARMLAVFFRRAAGYPQYGFQLSQNAHPVR